MIKKLAELKVNNSQDYYGTTVKALEKAGFTVIEEVKGLFETHYIIAIGEPQESEVKE